MRFVFLRHGHRLHGQDMLSPGGRQAATNAGQFLLQHGIAPDVLCHTAYRRTQHTAELVASVAAPACPLLDVGAGFVRGASADAIAARIQSWLEQFGHPAQVVGFVGHAPQQFAVLRSLATGRIAVPSSHRACALVFELVGDSWELGPCYVGEPEPFL